MCEADCVTEWRHFPPGCIVVRRVREAEGINENTKTYLATARSWHTQGCIPAKKLVSDVRGFILLAASRIMTKLHTRAHAHCLARLVHVKAHTLHLEHLCAEEEKPG